LLSLGPLHFAPLHNPSNLTGIRVGQLLGRIDDPKLRLILCHLGGGCSLCATVGGRSVDTTMGFTPLDGIAMCTRSGAVDPGILLYLLQQGVSTDDLEKLLNKESGLKGLSGLSGDTRVLLPAAMRGDGRARLALDVFIHRLQAGIGAMLASLARELQQSLAAQANAIVSAESYQDAAEKVRRLGGQLLPFRDVPHECEPSQITPKYKWDKTMVDGLRKTYRKGRRLLRQVEATPQSPEEKWHELRKRAKDLGYQLALVKKVKGVKPLLAQLDEVGSTLGDARDLSLLRNCLNKVEDKHELTSAERQSYRLLLTHIDGQSQQLHRRALKAAQHAYRPGAKRFTAKS
jgi:CHAD domain-containing protein